MNLKKIIETREKNILKDLLTQKTEQQIKRLLYQYIHSRLPYIESGDHSIKFFAPTETLNRLQKEIYSRIPKDEWGISWKELLKKSSRDR